MAMVTTSIMATTLTMDFLLTIHVTNFPEVLNLNLILLDQIDGNEIPEHDYAVDSDEGNPMLAILT